MTSYLPESRILEAGSILYSPAARYAATHMQGGRLTQDSIASCQEESAQSKDAASKCIILGARASLPQPNTPSSKDELMILAEAFVKAFSSMDKSVITQHNDYVQLQQLDQTQTQAVLQSTTNAINQEEAANTLSAQISDYQQKMASNETILGWTMFGLGIALMLGTFISGFFDFGASDAALPEEAELLDMGATAMEEAGDSADSAVDDLSSNIDDADLAGSTEDSSTMSESESSIDEVDTTAENNEQTAARDLNKSSETASSTALRWLKGWGKVLLKMTIGAGFASPMLVKGIVNIKYLAPQLQQLSDSQSNVGQALDALQVNNMYFQFLQQLVQREGSVMQDETNNASEVIDTFSSVTSAYRGISYGLANAV
jgi:hypothetical protein